MSVVGPFEHKTLGTVFAASPRVWDINVGSAANGVYPGSSTARSKTGDLPQESAWGIGKRQAGRATPLSRTPGTSLLTNPDPPIVSVLEAAGWSESRRVSVEAWVERLREEGMEPFDAAIEILAEFGGLQLHHQFVVSDGTMIHISVYLDPLMAGLGEADRVEYWEELLEQRFYPIGEYDGHLLLVAEDGQVYLDGDAAGCRVGENFEEALQVIIVRDRPGVDVFDKATMRRVDRSRNRVECEGKSEE